MPCVWTHACRSLDAALHAAKAVLLRAVLAVAFVLVASQIAHATCTVTSPTLTLTSSAYTYPFAGGGTGVSVTFTASYNVTSSGGAGGQCGNQTIDIIPALTGGAFSGASCASLSMPISPNTTAVHTHAPKHGLNLHRQAPAITSRRRPMPPAPRSTSARRIR